MLTIPVHPELAAIIAATPIGLLTLLTTNTGKTYGANDFTDQFRSWWDAAGLPRHCVFHGPRKAALTWLANAGCRPSGPARPGGHGTDGQPMCQTRAG